MSNLNNIEEMNRLIEQSPKARRVYTIFIRCLSILLILLSIMVCIVMPIAGIIGILIGILIWIYPIRIKKNGLKRTLFVFPEKDKQGHSLLTVYDMNVSGIMHIHDNIDPQKIIPKLYIGEQIILEADMDNTYDENAVKVKTKDGRQLGWLPKGENLQLDVSKRLKEGQTVYARVKKCYPLDYYPGKQGLVIDIARYSRR